MITVEADGLPVNLQITRFSGGELQPRLSVAAHPRDVKIVNVTAHIWSPEELLEVALVGNAARHAFPHADRRLICPYLPYARQDRVCFMGEAFALEVVAQLLRDNFDLRIVWDVHSAVAQHLIPFLISQPASDFASKINVDSNTTVVVAPDTGAHERALGVAEALHCRLAQATKKRNSDNGLLAIPEIEGDVEGATVLMVDDICDGGRTFINLAHVLRQRGVARVELYVTHGIFSNGFDDLRKVIDHIYCPNVHPRWVPAEGLDREGINAGKIIPPILTRL